MLYTEIVSRTFTAGILKGLTVEQRIRHLHDPRPVGSVHPTVPDTGSAYDDTILAIKEEPK